METRVLARGAGITLVSKLGSRALLLVIQILLARRLGPAGFGLLALGQVILQIISQLGTLGLTTGVIRFGVPSRETSLSAFSELLRNVLFVTLLSSLVFGGGGILIAPWLADVVLKKPELIGVLRAFSLAALILIWLNVLSAATRVSKRMEYSALALDVAPPLMSLLLLVAVIYIFKISILSSAVVILLGYAIGAALSNILYAQALSRNTADRPPFKDPDQGAAELLHPELIIRHL